MAIFSIGNNVYSTVYASGQPPKSKPQGSETVASSAGQALKAVAEIAGEASPVLSAASQIAGKLLHTTA